MLVDVAVDVVGHQFRSPVCCFSDGLFGVVIKREKPTTQDTAGIERGDTLHRPITKETYIETQKEIETEGIKGHRPYVTHDV